MYTYTKINLNCIYIYIYNKIILQNALTLYPEFISVWKRMWDGKALYLSRHHFPIDAADVNPSVKTCLIMWVNYIASESIGSSSSTVVRSLNSVTKFFRKLQGKVAELEQCHFWGKARAEILALDVVVLKFRTHKVEILAPPLGEGKARKTNNSSFWVCKDGVKKMISELKTFKSWKSANFLHTH